MHVQEDASGNGPMLRYVALVTGDNGVSVAVELAMTDSQLSVADLGQTPRVFLAFPLSGTRDFCLPVVVNHEKFQPREDRDTLVLMPKREGKHRNMGLMEDACDLAARLAVLAAEKDWRGAPALVRLNELRQWDWVDAAWLRDLMVTRFVQPLRSEILMKTASGGRIAPDSGKIPLACGSASCGLVD